MTLRSAYYRPRNISFGGAVLRGSAKIAGVPDVALPDCRVQLLRSVIVPQLIFTTRSDDAGAWSFSGVQARTPGDGYTVIAYDPTVTFDPSSKINLIPSAMPADPLEHV